MANPSSATVMFRALVMLACVVAIPLAAVLGRSLPEMVKTLLAGRWPVRQAALSDGSDQTPPLEPAALPGGGSTMPPRVVGSDWPTRPLQAMPQEPGRSFSPADSTVIPAGYESAVEVAGQANSGDDRFQQIQGRLHQLGATHYRLEYWGNREQLYHFYCEVAVGADPNYVHHFQATTADRLEAMRQVLDQVEAWRTGLR